MRKFLLTVATAVSLISTACSAQSLIGGTFLDGRRLTAADLNALQAGRADTSLSNLSAAGVAKVQSLAPAAGNVTAQSITNAQGYQSVNPDLSNLSSTGMSKLGSSTVTAQSISDAQGYQSVNPDLSNLSSTGMSKIGSSTVTAQSISDAQGYQSVNPDLSNISPTGASRFAVTAQSISDAQGYQSVNPDLSNISPSGAARFAVTAQSITNALNYVPVTPVSPLFTGQMVMPQGLFTDSDSGASILSNCNASAQTCNYDGSNTARGGLIQYCSNNGCLYDPTYGTHLYSQVLIEQTTRKPSSGSYGAQENAFTVNQLVNTGDDTGNPGTTNDLNNGKSGITCSQKVLPGGGNTWCYVADVTLTANLKTSQTHFLAEWDLTNNAWDAAPGTGVGNIWGFWISGGGNYSSTAGLYLAPNAGGGGSTGAFHYGILMQNGPSSGNNGTIPFAKDIGVFENDNATTAFQAGGTHTNDFLSAAAGSNGFKVQGAKTNAGFVANLYGAVSAFSAVGGYSGQAISLVDSSPAGVNIAGAHSVSITTSGDSAGLAMTSRAEQKTCYDMTHWCVRFTFNGDKLVFSNSQDVDVMSIDGSGVLRVKGTIVQSTTP